MTTLRFNVGEQAVQQARESGDWSGIGFAARDVIEVLEAAEAVLDAATKAKERGQPITPTGVRLAVGLLRAVMVGNRESAPKEQE